jgi:dephospho-CoA kinase
MKQIGITGGIGTGKSIVSRIFGLLHVPVYDADSRAKALYAQSPKLKSRILAAFGEESYCPDGTFNRSWMAAKVFSDPPSLQKLNALVHPAVKEDYHFWLGTLPAGTHYVLREAALMFESGSDKGLDAVVMVTAPIELRLQRVLRRDPFRSEAQILAIMDNQWPEEEKRKKATHCIVNDDLTPVLPQVLALHSTFLT